MKELNRFLFEILTISKELVHIRILRRVESARYNSVARSHSS